MALEKKIRNAGRACVLSAVMALPGCIVPLFYESVPEETRICRAYASASERTKICKNEASLMPLEKENNELPAVIDESEINFEYVDWSKYDASLPVELSFSKPVEEIIDEPDVINKSVPEEPVKNNPVKDDYFNLAGLALNFFAAAGSFLALRHLFNKVKNMSFQELKNKYDFIVSLPELSRPGVEENDVYNFLAKYSDNFPPAALKIFSNMFVNVLADANMFSKLELTVLANTVKNNYDCDNDFVLFGSLIDILVYYSRNVAGFDELITTVKNLNKKSGYANLPVASEKIKKILKMTSANDHIFDFHDEYVDLLERADVFVSKGDDYDAVLSLEEAVLINPKRSEAYFGLSDLYQNADRPDDALAVLNGLIMESPCGMILSKAYLKKAELLAGKRYFDLALASLEKVSDGDIGKYRLKKLCSKNGLSFKEKAIDFLKKAYFCYLKPGMAYYESTKK